MIRTLRLCLLGGMLLLALAAPLAAAADEQSGSDSESGTLQPTYEPRPPAQKPTYSTDYIFAITRAVTDSTLVPAARVPLYFLSIPTDLVFLPIELIAGFFPGE